MRQKLASVLLGSPSFSLSRMKGFSPVRIARLRSAVVIVHASVWFQESHPPMRTLDPHNHLVDMNGGEGGDSNPRCRSETTVFEFGKLPCWLTPAWISNARKIETPARCQRTTVSGRTMASASTMPGARRYSPTNTNRSKVRKTDLFGDLRRSTLICCRRTRISASSRTLERNKLVSAVHSSMRTSTIGHEHHSIRPASQPYRVSDKDSV